MKTYSIHHNGRCWLRQLDEAQLRRCLACCVRRGALVRVSVNY